MFYNGLGDLVCIVTETWQGAICPDHPAAGGERNPVMRFDYLYDDFQRLTTARSWAVDAGVLREVDEGRTSHDVLDRPTSQQEGHNYAGIDPTAPLQRTTTFSHLGLTNAIAQEVLSGQSASAGTKDYRFDGFGARTTLRFAPGAGATEPAGRYSYSYDLHGDVSLLLQDTNAPKATYGFQPYGAEARDPLRATDTADHFGDPTQSYRDAIRGDINLHDPTNPIRNTAKRLDSGHGGLDMGARQYSPDYKRFLQRDYLRPAQVQFGLVNSDWSANSYALASGNPVNFVEAGGHAVIVDEAGYGTASVGLLDPADWSCIPTPILGICIPWPKPIQSIGPTPAPTPTPTPAPQPTKTPDPKPTQVQQQAPGITACPPSSQATKWDLLPAPPGTGSWYGSGVHAFVRGPEQHSAAGECHVNVEIISTNWTENYHLYRRSGVYEDVILAGPASGQWKQFDFSGQLISANPPLNAPGVPLGPDEEATALIVAAAATATYQIATNNRLPATLTETYFYVTIDEPLHALAFFVP